MTESLDIRQLEEGSKGVFYVGRPGRFQAELSYSLASPNKMIIDHTRVNDDLRGKGIALRLVERAVEHARINNLRIIPLCPYTNAQFRKHPEWQDLYLAI